MARFESMEVKAANAPCSVDLVVGYNDEHVLFRNAGQYRAAPYENGTIYFDRQEVIGEMEEEVIMWALMLGYDGGPIREIGHFSEKVINTYSDVLLVFVASESNVTITDELFGIRIHERRKDR